jgi:O-antigen ligase
MKDWKIDNKIIIKIVSAFTVSLIIAVASFGAIGKKNSALLLISAFLAVFAVSMLNDRKKSILIFIVSLPLLVTARKFFYVDFLVFKLSMESLYITALFFMSFKDIIKTLKLMFKGPKLISFDYIIYTIIFMILAMNSTMFSSDIQKSFRLVFISVIIPIMFMVSVIANFKLSDIKTILYTMILQCSFSSMYGFVQIAKIAKSGISFSRISSHRQEYTFGYHNVNIYAAIVILIIPIILERILYHKNTKNEQIFLYIAAVINAFGVLATFTRGAWMMFIVGLGIVLISKRYRKVIYGFIALLILISRPLLAFILQRGMGTKVDILANESFFARIEATLTSFRIAMDYPFGIGSGNYAALYKRYIISGYQLLPYSFRTRISVASYNMEHAHNLFFQIGVELGVLTMVVFIFIVINRFLYTIKNFSKLRGIVAGLASYFIYSVATGGELEHKGVITGTLLLWLVFAIIQIYIMSNDAELDKDRIDLEARA